MMRDLDARGFELGGDIRESKEIKIVVFPEPVGNEHPIRLDIDIRHCHLTKACRLTCCLHSVHPHKLVNNVLDRVLM